MEKTKMTTKFLLALLFFAGVGVGLFFSRFIDDRGGVAHVESVIRTGDNIESIIKANCNDGCGGYIRIIEKDQPDKWYDKDELCECLNDGRRLSTCTQLTNRPGTHITCAHY